MKNLNNYGVQELNAREMKKTDGGFLGLDDLIIGFAIAAAVEVIGDWEHFKSGLFGK